VLQSISVGDVYEDYADACAVCNQFTTGLLRHMLPSFVNVFLKNYVKKRNDEYAARGGKKGKYKLQTLS
jgi:hypothetical protein